MYESVEPVLAHGWYKYEWRFYEPGATEPIPTDAAVYTMDTTSVDEFELQPVNFNSAGL